MLWPVRYFRTGTMDGMQRAVQREDPARSCFFVKTVDILRDHGNVQRRQRAVRFVRLLVAPADHFDEQFEKIFFAAVPKIA